MARLCALVLAASFAPSLAMGQTIGTFRWQLEPFCNVLSLVVTQNSGVFTLDGFDDQCGATTRAPVTGLATPNPNGTIEFGLTIVASPGAVPLHVAAAIGLATLGGTWRDSAGETGALVFRPGAGTGGDTRPAGAGVIPGAFVLSTDGALLAGGRFGQGAIPTSGPGTRMMWHPRKAAFRAGRATGSEWDDQNIGNYSVAFGGDTLASGDFSVALGRGTQATKSDAVALGFFTKAFGTSSLATGAGTEASGPSSAAFGAGTRALGNVSLAAGSGTVADGFAAVAMGANSFAGGDYSVALGYNAVVTQAAPGSFVFADRSNLAATFGSLGPNGFNVRAAGGVGFYTDPDATVGALLPTGSGAWTVVSDVNMKENFREIDGDAVLSKIAGMPVREWNYTTQDAAIRHVGPTAQDFHAAFGLGESELRISTIDADGIALAAIQALEARTRDVQATNDALARDNAALRRTVDALEASLAALLARLDRLGVKAQ